MSFVVFESTQPGIGPGAHSEIFKAGVSVFHKLFQPLMKMHAIIVKQGLAVIVAFCYNICLFRNPVITILKVVGCEDCVRENKLFRWESMGAKPPAAEHFLQFVRKK